MLSAANFRQIEHCLKEWLSGAHALSDFSDEIGRVAYAPRHLSAFHITDLSAQSCEEHALRAQDANTGPEVHE